jgi:hypothetical protein
LTVTALLEVGTGLLLLAWPALVLALLFGWRQGAPETLVLGRVAGAAVLSIGVMSWTARHGAWTPGQLGVLVGLVIYDAVSAAVLVWAAFALGMVGVLLWPAVVYHVAFLAWGAAGLSGPGRPRADDPAGTEH